MKIRDRYAPSPTGPQHIGGVRTALFNYLFARSQGGTFILRLEDTDQNRSEDQYVQNLYETFSWLGFNWDEGPDRGGDFGPYIQSQRSELYQQYAAELLKRDGAYRCFCSSERIDQVRKEREASQSSQTGYDRLCRSIPPEEAEKRAAAGEAHTIRLKIPLGEKTVFNDHLIGQVEWKNEDINPDPVLLKSDGYPTYHLANVVDDHLMEVSHILRAQEWLPSVPLHVIMYRAFGWEHPEFCHLPLIMGLDGKKLSKRHGSTSIDEFRRQGILSEALINYVALVGASYEEGKDIYTLDELVQRFSLEKLSKSPGIFDYKKLEWYNGHYIRSKSDEDLAALSLPFAIEQGLFPSGAPDEAQKELYTRAMGLVKERAVYLTEIPEKLGYLFNEIPMAPKEEFIPKKGSLEMAIDALQKVRPLIDTLAQTKTDQEAEDLFKALSEKEGLKLGDLMMPLRLALTGSRVSPPLFGSIRLLGAATSLARIDRALEGLS
ncbi:MAG: glutamate--tRNA ligase [Treponema sp.]|nr:glutamate--tRNA ligase [Treponema sp.]